MNDGYTRALLRLSVFSLSLSIFSPVSGQDLPQPWESITDERLAVPEPGDWVNYRRTYDVAGFSPLVEINRDNVDELRMVWSWAVEDGNRWVPTPIVANGLMYVSEGMGRVTAFNAATGDIVWQHTRRYPQDIGVSQAYNKHRGVSIYGDNIYWGTADSYLVALDARTGEQVWEVQTADYTVDGGHSHPPLIVDGKALLGRTGGDLGTQGFFLALDADSGEELWRFNTVPVNEGDPAWNTWSRSDSPPLGGTPWNTASYDAELGLVYFGTGQPYPWSALLRGPGDALYTNSILAVDINTGERRWHYQVMPNDSWDRAAFESLLVDVEINGEMRKALIQTSKIGWGVMLDRETGEFLHAFETAYDNLVTGFENDGRPILNPELVPTPADMDSGKVFEVCPFYHGGRDLNTASWDAATGTYYIGMNNSCMDVSFFSQDYDRGTFYTGMSGRAKPAPGYDYVGEFVAFDPVTGEKLWTYQDDKGSAMTASALATAGGVVFGGTAEREFFALNSQTGERLWRARLNGDISGAPISFEVDGKQYIAVGAGGRIAQAFTYRRLSDTELSPGGGVMWVFALPD